MSWALAARNLLRDRRRSAVTLASVAIGLTAMLLFLSYIRFIEAAMARLVIFQDGNAHVQVYRAGGPENLSAFPARYSLGRDDQQAIARAIAAAAGAAKGGVVRHSPQLSGVGMLHNGDKATVFVARGVQPGADAALRDTGGFADAAEDRLPEDDPDAVLLTRQVAELVGLRDKADPVQLSAATYGGRFNAIDAVPAGRFTTGIEAVESTGIKLPLRALQSLYDTQDVSRIVVQLKDRADAQPFARALQAALDGTANGRYVVTRWDSPQVGQLYLSFMGFADTMFLFTGVVLTLIAVATVQHTISANVSDRLKEIGMLRSLGFSRGSVTGMFVRESLLLAALGAAIALLVAFAIAGTGAASFETALPRLAVKVPVTLELPPGSAAILALLVVACMGAASWWTARRVTRGATARPGPFTLARLVAASLACVFVTAGLAPRGAGAAVPDAQTLGRWLEKADASRGGGAGYSWTSRVHSQEASEATDTTYSVAVRDGRALVQVTSPPRQAGEKILLDGRAMWYGKKGLRKPVSISPQQRLTGEAANGDIAAVHYARDYDAALVGEASVGGRDCYELMLVARNDQVTYDRIRYFIDKDTLLGARADFMTASGVVFKSATFEYANKVRGAHGEIPFVSRMRIVNATFPDRFSEIAYGEVVPAEHRETLFRIDNLLGP